MTAMEDALFIIAVILLGMGGVLGIAYSLDARRQRHGPIGPRLPPPGAIGQALWRGARILTIVMLLCVAAAYLLHLPDLAWLAVGCLVLFFIDHTLYRVIRLTGR